MNACALNPPELGRWREDQGTYSKCQETRNCPSWYSLRYACTMRNGTIRGREGRESEGTNVMYMQREAKGCAATSRPVNDICDTHV